MKDQYWKRNLQSRNLRDLNFGSMALLVGLHVCLFAGGAVNGRAENSTNHEPQAMTTPAAPGILSLKKLGLADLMNIEVSTVSRTESTMGQSAAAIFVVTPEMIRRSGATTIPELFRMVPGLEVARLDNNKWAVGARGFNQRFAGNLLVQIDGRTLYSPVFSGVYWDTVDYPLEDIERIEVIRGPGASMWGANAVNGVINIITKSAKDTQGGLVSAGSGTQERAFGGLRYGDKINDNLHYRIYGKGFTREEQFSAQGDPNDGWQRSSGGMRLDWQAGKRDTVMLEGDYFHAVAGRVDLRPLAAPPFFYTNAENDTTDGGNILARWTHLLDGKSSWILQAYWDRIDRKSDHGLIGLQWDTYDVDFQHQFPLGERQTIVYGFGYRFLDAVLKRSNADNGFAITWDPAHPTRQLFSAFVQDQITLVEDTLNLTLGSKIEHNDFTGVEVQPSARLLWTPTKRQSIWTAVSRAVRTPSFLEDEVRQKTLTAPGSPVIGELRGNSDLEAEDVMAYEVGYRVQATERLSFDVATFYNVYDNLIGTLPGARETNAPVVIVPANRGNTLSGSTYGAEVAATWQMTEGWRLYGAYTLLEMELHRASGLSPAAEAAEGQSPAHQLYLQSSWDLSRTVELDLIGRTVDSLSGFNPGHAPGVSDGIDRYTTLDLRVAWKPRSNLQLEIVGQNLLDEHHPEFGTSPVVRSPLVEIRRSVYGRLTYWW